MLIYGHMLHGCRVVCPDGVAGRVHDLLFDDQSWQIRHVAIRTGTWPLDRIVLLPPETVRLNDPDFRSVRVDLSTGEVHNAPGIDQNKPVSRQEELRLHQHQGPMLGLPWDGFSRMVVVPTATADRELAESGESPLAQSDPHLRRCGAVRGYGVRLHTGDLFGRVEDFVVDVVRWRIRYLVVQRGTWWIRRLVLLEPAVVQNVSWNQQAVETSLAPVASKRRRTSLARPRVTARAGRPGPRRRGR